MLITVVVVAATGILFLIRAFIAFSMELWDGRKPAITNSKLKTPGHAEPFIPAPQSSRVSGFESRLRSAAMAVNEADERAEVRHFDQWARRADF
jgi:hypothetical protein